MRDYILFVILLHLIILNSHQNVASVDEIATDLLTKPTVSSIMSQLLSDNTTSSCYIGSYRVTKEPYSKCAGWRICDPGYFCPGVEGIRKPCPPGTYGSKEGTCI